MDANKLKEIKSNYIIKKIFYQLNRIQNLELIRYNKLLKKRMEVSIEDYKFWSGRIQKVESDGNRKVYILDTNILIFEGKYLNGLKHGKGKEYYDNGKLKFEGEYFKGKKIEGIGYDSEGNKILVLERNGKGKEFYYNGNIQFKGEYLNGKRWNGKGYNKQGKKKIRNKIWQGKRQGI